MANLHTDFAGIKSPNPFWLASAPPTDDEVVRVRVLVLNERNQVRVPLLLSMNCIATGLGWTG